MKTAWVWWTLVAGLLGAVVLVYLRDPFALLLAIALGAATAVAIVLRSQSRRSSPALGSPALGSPALGSGGLAAPAHWFTQEEAAPTNVEEDLEPMEAMGTIAGGIGHEFNNLLVGILGSAHMATLERGTPHSVQRYLTQIEDTGRRAGHLVHKLLAIAGEAPVRPEPVRLGVLVHHVLDEMDLPDAVTLIEDVVTPRATVPVDESQVRLAVRHLVHNAIDALPPDRPGRITVRSGIQDYARADLRHARAGSASLDAGRYAFVEVVDSGAGMDPDTEMRMFDPFFSTRDPGRGLGLAAVYGIVRRHAGGLFVKTVAGQGTLVRIVLPTAPVYRADPAPRALPTPTGMVLLIEQDAPVQAYVRAVLRRRGLQVLTASDGVDGLAIFAQRVGTIDVVLLDATLRAPDAEAVLRDLRARHPEQAIVLTGPRDASDVPNAQIPRLTKPFKVEALLDAVRPWAQMSPRT